MCESDSQRIKSDRGKASSAIVHHREDKNSEETYLLR